MTLNSADIIVGCPCRSREWILDDWFDHIYAACHYADLEPLFCFVCDPDDAKTIHIIQNRADDWLIVYVNEPHRRDVRQWSAERYHHMVRLRNILLGIVRDVAPNYFLSLDSDILLHQKSLVHMIAMLDEHSEWSAIGSKCFMTPIGKQHPSYSFINTKGQLLRSDSDAVFQTEVIMAIKLMNHDAYMVDYTYDDRGEDIGWSLNCKKQGLRLGWSGRWTSKHVLSPDLLEKVDARCGY